MKKKYEFQVYEINDENDYSTDYLRTIKHSYKAGDEVDLTDNIIAFLKKYKSKYTDENEAKQYLVYLEKNGYINLSEYKNGRQNAIFKQKAIDFINNNMSIYDKE